MPAIASLEVLKKLNAEIKEIEDNHPEVCKKITELIRKNRKVGYRNFCKLFTGERSPEQLKEEKRK
jgi:hypothetical protein